ncbi:MAG: hypothetical protein HC834_11360 [Rhodospirillales bacterium]|nr:hypothetical protein [Rhodospirillales bacterium]
MVVLPAAIVAGIGAGCGEGGKSGSATPTFTADIAPIIFENCSACHRPGQAAPFPLLTYADVKERARQIAEVTGERYMPPWLPVPGFNHFKDERRLTDAQIALIQRWADAGAPEGNAARLPAAPQFEDEWMRGHPDLVVRMPEAFSIRRRDRMCTATS